MVLVYVFFYLLHGPLLLSLRSVASSLDPDALLSCSLSSSCPSVHWTGLFTGSAGAKEGMLHWALFRATGSAMALRNKLHRKIAQCNSASIKGTQQKNSSRENHI